MSPWAITLCFLLQASMQFDIEVMCKNPKEGLLLLEHGQSINYNVKSKFEEKALSALRAKAGGFGQVLPVSFPRISNLKGVIAKKIDLAKCRSASERADWLNMASLEIRVGYMLAGAQISPRVIGCALLPKEIYIIQQRLMGDLTNKAFISKLKSLPLYEQLGFWALVFYKLHYLWDRRFVHQDLKPANIMVDFDLLTAYLIDFGLVQHIPTEENHLAGTPPYMSIDRLRNRDLLAESDIYAVALTIVEVYSSFNELFTLDNVVVSNQSGFDMIDNDCFTTDRIVDCLPSIINNAKKILKKAKFGDVQTNISLSTLNFTTLLICALDYYDLDFKEDLFFFLFTRLLDKEYKSYSKLNKGKPINIGHQRLLDIQNQKKYRLDLEKAVAKGQFLEKMEEAENQRMIDAIIAQRKKDEEVLQRRAKEQKLKQQRDEYRRMIIKGKMEAVTKKDNMQYLIEQNRLKDKEAIDKHRKEIPKVNVEKTGHKPAIVKQGRLAPLGGNVVKHGPELLPLLKGVNMPINKLEPLKREPKAKGSNEDGAVVNDYKAMKNPYLDQDEDQSYSPKPLELPLIKRRVPDNFEPKKQKRAALADDELNQEPVDEEVDTEEDPFAIPSNIDAKFIEQFSKARAKLQDVDFQLTVHGEEDNEELRRYKNQVEDSIQELYAAPNEEAEIGILENLNKQFEYLKANGLASTLKQKKDAQTGEFLV